MLRIRPFALALLLVAVPVAAQQDVRMGLTTDPQLAAALADISASRIHATDSVLASFGTRHAMSDTMSTTRGVGAARRWIHAQLEAVSHACDGCLKVEYDPAMITIRRDPAKPVVNIVNVLAWLPGHDPRRVIVMGGHYDTCTCSTNPFDFTTNAPGADDDGSGTSAVMELARVFSRHFPHGLDATVVFALYSGEEMGLLGSAHLAKRLKAQGYEVTAGMTDDMVGNVSAQNGSIDTTHVRLFGGDPDNGPSRELERYAWALDNLYHPGVTAFPVFRLDRIRRGGDHIPFWHEGAAGIRFSEMLENYTRQHSPRDVMKYVDFDYVAKIAKLNGAVVGALAAAPPAPDSVTATRDRASGGYKWLLRWKRVPGATAYEVLVRRTTSPTWEHVIAVGNVTSYLLPDQLDNLWAGVRAVGANGQRSLASVVPPPRFVTR